MNCWNGFRAIGEAQLFERAETMSLVHRSSFVLSFRPRALAFCVPRSEPMLFKFRAVFFFSLPSLSFFHL